MRFLFDRICLSEKSLTDSLSPFRSSLERSVTQELTRITNQRQYFAGFQYRKVRISKPDVLAFGISKGIGETYNSQTSKALAIEIKRAILAHEPRLLSPSVSLQSSSKSGGMPEVVISGCLQVDGQVKEYKRHFSSLGRD